MILNELYIYVIATSECEGDSFHTGQCGKAAFM